jgi:Protein of unknown function (DUF2608)
MSHLKTLAGTWVVDYAIGTRLTRSVPASTSQTHMTRYLLRHTRRLLKGLRFGVSASLVFACAAAASATGYRTTSDFKDVASTIEQSADQFGPDHLLLVLDIDNTLLAMDRPLGSEQWFDWQTYLLQNEPESPQLVAQSFQGILEAQGRLYQLGTMHPTQQDLPAIIRRIQRRGIATVVLTSRGDEFRAATERELVRNGFMFGESALPVSASVSSTYLPYDLANPEAVGLTTVDLESTANGTPRPVSYANGIMMVAGQNKGIMLTTLLHRAKRNIQAVVFVDNRAEQVASMLAYLSQHGIDTTTILYERVENEVKAFDYGSKDEVTRDWRSLMSPPVDCGECSSRPASVRRFIGRNCWLCK